MLRETASRRARDLFDSAIVWDNHGCLPLKTEADFLPQLGRYRRAGVNLASINVGDSNVSLHDQLRVLSFMRQWIARHADSYQLVSTVDDIKRCKREDRLGIVFDVEGMFPVQDNPSFVQTFYELGVRWMLIAYNHNNKAGGGCLDIDTGLTDTGRAIIDEMQRVGMVLCLSHAGARTVAEALDYVSNPAIFSHSNPHSMWHHPRNVSDELMRACAKKGGVVGLNGIGIFLGSQGTLLETFLRHLHYTIDLIGPEHVGLGLDYVFNHAEYEAWLRARPDMVPAGMDIDCALSMLGPEAFGEIAEDLARTNLTDTQIRGVLGENWLRVAEQVWRKN